MTIEELVEEIHEAILDGDEGVFEDKWSQLLLAQGEEYLRDFGMPNERMADYFSNGQPYRLEIKYQTTFYKLLNACISCPNAALKDKYFETVLKELVPFRHDPNAAFRNLIPIKNIDTEIFDNICATQSEVVKQGLTPKQILLLRKCYVEMHDLAKVQSEVSTSAYFSDQEFKDAWDKVSDETKNELTNGKSWLRNENKINNETVIGCIETYFHEHNTDLAARLADTNESDLAEEDARATSSYTL